MKAIVSPKYGPPEVLQFQEVEKPAPKDNEILIRVHATAVNSGDIRIRGLNVPTGFGLLMRLIFGFSRPKQPILGVALAGTVEAVGKEVTQFKAGDAVLAMDGARQGAYAEYKVMPESGAIARKPDKLTFEEAAALPFGGTTALDFLRDKGKIRRGEKILINGASGAVGTAAVQLARHFGAVVTGVSSTANLELVRSLGADKVIDYTKEDFTKNGEQYDLIMDIVGNAPFSRVKNSLTEKGRLLMIVAGLPEMLQSTWINLTGKKKAIAGVAGEKAEDLRFLAELAEKGQFKPVVDRSYPLEQMVEAHRYVETGRKKGNVVVIVG